ncbi:MAG: VanZ family protein [Flavobacteriaceae bacterium]
MLKKSALLLVIIYTILLTFVSLIKPENIPNIEVSYSDKIFHFLAYCLLTFFWFCAFFYHFNFKKSKSIIFAAIVSIVFGIIIEVLQDKLTTYRTLDILDVVANTSGVILAVLVLVINKNIDVKKL